MRVKHSGCVTPPVVVIAEIPDARSESYPQRAGSRISDSLRSDLNLRGISEDTAFL